MKFSLVIPCFNEADNIPLLLEQCSKVTTDHQSEVILVDNGSTDNTQEVLKSNIVRYPGCRFIRVEENQGYGHGILAGLNSANGRILGWTHADMQTDPSDVLRGLAYFDEHGENIFCKGKRFGRPMGDIFFTFSMSIFETILLGRSMWDINAQPTMFSKDFFEKWTEPPEDFSLDLYAYFTAKKSKLRIYRFPVKFGDRAYGSSHWNIDWNSKINFIKRTMIYSLKLRRDLHK